MSFINTNISKSVTDKNIIIFDNKLKDNSNQTNSYARTEDDLNNALRAIFKKFKIDDLDALLKILDNTITKEELLGCSEDVLLEKIIQIENLLKENSNDYGKHKINYLIAKNTNWVDFNQFIKEVNNNDNCDVVNAIKIQYKKKNNKELNIETLSQDEIKHYLKEYFEDNYKKYLEFANNNPQIAKRMLLGVMLAKTSDKDKRLLLPIINEVLKDAEILDVVFKSFTNEESISDLADSLSYNDWVKLPNDELKVKYIQNMSQKGIDMQKLGYKSDVEKFYKEYGQELIRIQNKINANKELEKEENDLINKRDKLVMGGSMLATSIAANKYLPSEEIKINIEDITKVSQEYGFEDEYLTNLAKIIKNNNNLEFKLSKEDLINILDSFSDNKFSEKYNNIQENTATDEKTGGFKVDAEASSAAAIKLESITAQILSEITDTENIITLKKAVETSTQEDEYYNSKDLSIGHNNIKNAIDILSGHEENNTTYFEKKNAINTFSNMNSSNQLRLLNGSIVSRYFRKCIENAKFSTLQKWNDLGLNARTKNDTDFANEKYLNEKNKKNDKSLPS